MVRKFCVLSVLACALLLAGCHHKVQNPLANIDSKQPDKGLYDRAIDSMKHGHYEVARTLLETLINTYPDSEYLARAKLAVGDSWYQEGGTAAWQQAEAEYKDFQTFFPNLPEASEAQLKVANIHYRQMEKPDRDFAQAMRAADEYKSLIQTYPDSPLVPEAKQRLREVQEVLAERQYRIANFYFLRQNLAASQARLQSLVDSYPLYSKIDEALYTLGQLYEREAVAMRKQNIPEAQKERLAADFQKHAIESYSRIITRYPAMDRADDAKRRLQALNAPVPTPTAEAMAESKAEEQSRLNVSMMQGMMGNFKKRPMVAKSSRVGEPDLKEEEIVDPAKMVHDLENQLNASGQPNEKVGLETVTGVGKGTPRANEPPPGTTNANKPAEEGAPPPAAPAQVNEVKQQAQQEAESGQTSAAAATSDQTAKKVDKKKESTSKKKKKKGLGKLNPF
ncbi:MAG TPA: outer membrane protein assembly factor BamD [Candidatus Angelobacter sp.]|jgi:outer membrane protein assembly factor BamD|nr:outer membrane protein assembly factor BamD [Candidatus Angelobacter sp.]